MEFDLEALQELPPEEELAAGTCKASCRFSACSALTSTTLYGQ
ncbi:ALQxL family class IV lanthipeptide [Kitasatospora sp. NPDC049285]